MYNTNIFQNFRRLVTHYDFSFYAFDYSSSSRIPYNRQFSYCDRLTVFNLFIFFGTCLSVCVVIIQFCIWNSSFIRWRVRICSSKIFTHSNCNMCDISTKPFVSCEIWIIIRNFSTIHYKLRLHGGHFSSYPLENSSAVIPELASPLSDR